MAATPISGPVGLSHSPGAACRLMRPGGPRGPACPAQRPGTGQALHGPVCRHPCQAGPPAALRRAPAPSGVFESSRPRPSSCQALAQAQPGSPKTARPGGLGPLDRDENQGWGPHGQAQVRQGCRQHCGPPPRPKAVPRAGRLPAQQGRTWALRPARGGLFAFL